MVGKYFGNIIREIIAIKQYDGEVKFSIKFRIFIVF